MGNCTFPIGLLPDFSGIPQLPQLDIDICALVDGGTAFVNPLSQDITDGIASIDAATTTLNTQLSTLGADISQLTTWESSPPTNWTAQDITDVKTAAEAKQTCGNNLSASRALLRTEINTNFLSHTNRLAGVDLGTGNKPNIFGIAGTEQALGVIKQQHGKAQTNTTTDMFGSIYNGGDQMASIKAETDGTPMGDVTALAIQSTITGGTAAADKANLIASIDALACQTPGTTDTLLSGLSALITADDAAFDAAVAEIIACTGALMISSWLTNPFKLPLLGCIGSPQLKLLAGI